jgi:hypothetical protein
MTGYERGRAALDWTTNKGLTPPLIFKVFHEITALGHRRRAASSAHLCPTI